MAREDHRHEADLRNAVPMHVPLLAAVTTVVMPESIVSAEFLRGQTRNPTVPKHG